MYDVLIIGAGPAGMTAAIYTKRFNLSVGLIEAICPGGEVVKNNNIKNYPGFSNISGSDLALKMFEQTMNLNVEYITNEINSIYKENEIFTLTGLDGTVYQSKAVIIATGTQDKVLDIPSEKKYLYKGISWCAVCDGALYKNKDVAVVGGGMSAISSVLSLARSSKTVHLIHRRDEFRGEKLDLEKIKSLDNVVLHTNSIITEMYGDKKLESIKIKNKNGNEEVINIECLFECVGKTPKTHTFSELIELDDNGYIVVDKDMCTSEKGIFACGDVVEKKVRQIATAINDGAIAAISANSYLK